jgi:hypothetical protein
MLDDTYEPVHPQHGDIEPGGYLEGDYDLTHCRHGSYTGYPGGPDYMCHWCEMGEEPPVYRYQVSFVLQHKDGSYSHAGSPPEFRFATLEECWTVTFFGAATLELILNGGLYPVVEELE